MSSNVQFGYPDIPKSITNKNVQAQYALDVDNPMSFVLFIKTISNSFEPTDLQKYYNEYLKRWNSFKKDKKISDDELISEKYKEFIKEISLNYSTLEEQKFLSNIDFNDPSDLAIAMPFYSKKLVEIAQYFNKKREEAKFQLVKKKLTGTNSGVYKSITDLTINYLESIQDGSFHFDMDQVKEKLEIEIEELFDTYPAYFNQEPNERIYDNKDLDWGYDIFLKTNSELLSTKFSNNPSTTELKELNDLIDNKRKLTQKYLSTDFYYISTGPTAPGSTKFNFISGKLFDVENSAKNFLNVDYPTTASTIKSNPISPREIGFFRPQKNAIIIVDGKNLSFRIDTSVLEQNKIYYFPDPFIHDSDVIVYAIDDSYLKHNFTSGLARNQPIQTQDAVFYQGYVSKNDITPIPDMSMLFNMGYIQDQKKDVYGNTFGLIKDNYNFRENVKNTEYNYIKSLLLNGYQYFDDFYGEAYNFDYSYSDYYTTPLTTKRSGLSTRTGGFSEDFNDAYTVFLRHFTPYQELKIPADTSSDNRVWECAGFNDPDGNAYLDPMSSDLSAFPGDNNYYFSSLIEGGINRLSPSVIRGLRDSLFPSVTASFNFNFKDYVLECGTFGDNFDFTFDFIDRDYLYISHSDGNSSTMVSSVSTIVESLFDRYDLPGKLYVKNIANQTAYNAVDLFDYWKYKFPNELITELNGSIKSFDFTKDVILIETSNYFVIDKIKYNNGIFENPFTENIYFRHSIDKFNKLSNRFKINDDIYYCILETPSISSNNMILYPKIYKFNIDNFANDLVFPLPVSKIYNDSQFYTVSSVNVRYTYADSPVITHDSRTNILNVSFLIKDQNDYISMQEYDFDMNSNMNLLNHNQYFDESGSYSNIFTSRSQLSSSLTIKLSSSLPLIINEELIL
jgi:hypothetical protein